LQRFLLKIGLRWRSCNAERFLWSWYIRLLLEMVSDVQIDADVVFLLLVRFTSWLVVAHGFYGWWQQGCHHTLIEILFRWDHANIRFEDPLPLGSRLLTILAKRVTINLQIERLLSLILGDAAKGLDDWDLLDDSGAGFILFFVLQVVLHTFDWRLGLVNYIPHRTNQRQVHRILMAELFLRQILLILMITEFFLFAGHRRIWQKAVLLVSQGIRGLGELRSVRDVGEILRMVTEGLLPGPGTELLRPVIRTRFIRTLIQLLNLPKHAFLLLFLHSQRLLILDYQLVFCRDRLYKLVPCFYGLGQGLLQVGDDGVELFVLILQFITLPRFIMQLGLDSYRMKIIFLLYFLHFLTCDIPMIILHRGSDSSSLVFS